MLVGNPDAKSKPDPDTYGYTCLVNRDLSTGSISGDTFNFDRDCPYGLKIETYFPSCWDGVNLYKSDGSHMAYPVLNGGFLLYGLCPYSHPIRVPAIMLEYTWFPNKISEAVGVPTKGRLAWANGDTTGYGAHADFVNG